MDDSSEKSSSVKYVASSKSSIKSISLNFLNIDNNDIDNAQIFENNKESSFCDKDLNEKIIKLFVGNHPLLPMKTIKKIARCNLMNQYYKSNDFYNVKVINEIILNECCHIVAEFKDYLIQGDFTEFLQQYYKKREIYKLLPNLYEYYIKCSVIFPNYVALPESCYIFKNIQKKQRIIDIQQEQEEKEEDIKNGFIEPEKEPTVFTTQAFDSILNQTDTSGVRHFFDIPLDDKDDCQSGILKLMNAIEIAEKKAGNNQKKNKVNVCKLKKGNNEIQYQYKKNNIKLYDENFNNKKFFSDIKNKKYDGGIFHKNKNKNLDKNIFELNNNIYNNYDELYPNDNIKQIFRQATENNNIDNYGQKNYKFSTQMTYINSTTNYKKNIFDLKTIDTKKFIEKNSDNKKYKNAKKENDDSIIFNEINDKKENLSRNNNNNYPLYKFNTNIKTYCDDKNTISSYKTKSVNKNRTKGYHTSRNKYDNKNMYINITKSNMSKNHKSIDNELDNPKIKKNMHHIQNKHNNIKNNIMNALLGSKNNNQNKKNEINDKFSDGSIFIDSVELNDIQDKENMKESENENNKQNMNNIDNYNTKISSISRTKTISMYLNLSKLKNNNINKKNHKKQISQNKIPNSLPDNKLKNKKKLNEEPDNKNKLKEFIDNYLEDYFSSKSNNFFEFNNINNNESKSKSKNKNKALTVRNKQEKIVEKSDKMKIRKNMFNFEKKISKKLSEKNMNIFEKYRNKNQNQKNSSIRINQSNNAQNSDRGCPLSARESNFKYQINPEMIELLSHKIHKLKQVIKEKSDKGSNSISSIFKKKIPLTNRKPQPQSTKKSEDFNSKTRNKKNKNSLVGATSSNINIGINKNLVNTIINSLYQTNLFSPNRKNNDFEQLIKTFNKLQKPINNNNLSSKNKNKGNNNTNNIAKKDSKNKKGHIKYNSINNNINNYNIEVNIKDNKSQQKKQNNKQQINDNVNSLNINFNNYTNNFNYNYNINQVSNNTNNININNNSIINNRKSSSQKFIVGKIGGKNNNLKGIPINGFDKLITKKYNTRNFNIPLSVTERAKKGKLYDIGTSNISNSNRYRKSNSKYMVNKIFSKK